MILSFFTDFQSSFVYIFICSYQFQPKPCTYIFTLTKEKKHLMTFVSNLNSFELFVAFNFLCFNLWMPNYKRCLWMKRVIAVNTSLIYHEDTDWVLYTIKNYTKIYKYIHYKNVAVKKDQIPQQHNFTPPPCSYWIWINLIPFPA